MVGMRRLSLSYGELSESRDIYRPRHAAPTMMSRLLTRIGRLAGAGPGEQAAGPQPPALPSGREQLALTAGPAPAPAAWAELPALAGAAGTTGTVVLAGARPELQAGSAGLSDADASSPYQYILLPAPVPPADPAVPASPAAAGPAARPS